MCGWPLHPDLHGHEGQSRGRPITKGCSVQDQSAIDTNTRSDRLPRRAIISSTRWSQCLALEYAAMTVCDMLRRSSLSPQRDATTSTISGFKLCFDYQVGISAFQSSFTHQQSSLASPHCLGAILHEDVKLSSPSPSSPT
jgi:hypothetical protein